MEIDTEETLEQCLCRIQAMAFIVGGNRAHEIALLGLGPRAYNALVRAGIGTLAQAYALAREDDADIIAMVRNFGKHSLRELRAGIAAHGADPIIAPSPPPSLQTHWARLDAAYETCG